MTELRALNRAMFWRILRRLLSANPGRLFVMLLALGAGAAVTAALLNLQVDAKRRLTTEFRAFGPNVLITPKETLVGSPNPATLSQDIEKDVLNMGLGSHVAPFLYFYADVFANDSERVPSVVVGIHPFTFDLLEPTWKIEPRVEPGLSDARPGDCMVGATLSSHLNLKLNQVLHVSVGAKQFNCAATRTVASGGEEDNQLFVDLSAAQGLVSLPNRISLMQILVPGTPQEIQHSLATLRQGFHDVDVRPIRQFTEGQAKIYSRISGLLTATVGIVLLLTALCVMAAMTNVAIERKMDVGLMKAIGGATRRVMRLFLAEAALLGLGGGLIGAALGILLSIGLGKAVFGVAARPRLIVYPVAVALTILVAVVSAFPLRRLAGIRPASVFRGEA